MAKKVNYQVGFTVDKTGLNDIINSLQAIQKLALKDFSEINKSLNLSEAASQLVQIKDTARDVQEALSKAFNSNLGTLNISKFNQELNNIGLEKIYADFNKAGNAGQSAFRRITTQILTTNMQLKQSNKLLDKMAETMSNTIRWTVASSALNSMTSSIQNALNYVEKLDASLNDIRIVTGKSADEMAEFAESANSVAKTLSASTRDITEGALIYYQQGDNDEDAMAKAEITQKTANVSGIDADEASEYLTAVWNGYKVANEAAEEGIQVYEEYVDKLAAVAAATASDLEESSIAMSKVASTANTMGVDFDQLNAQIATIISVTRQAPETVGNALKTVYARMSDLSIEGEDEFGTTLGDVSGQMAQMGITVLDESGALRDLGDVIEEVATKWNTWTEAQKTAAAQAMGGKYQYNTLMSLFENWDMYTEALETSSNALGTLDEQQEVYAERTTAHIQNMKTSFEDLYDSLLSEKDINAVVDAIGGAADTMANFVDGIGDGKTLLLGLGSVATQVFSGQIAKGLTNTINNFKVWLNNTQQLQEEMTILKTWANSTFANQEGGDAAIQAVVQAKEEMQKYQSIMSTEQINEGNALIKQMAQAKDLQLQWENTKNAVNEYLQALTEFEGTTTLFNATNDRAGELTFPVENVLTKLKEVQQSLKVIQGLTASGFTKENWNQASSSIGVFVERVQELQKLLGDNNDKYFKTIKEDLDALNKTEWNELTEENFGSSANDINTALTKIVGTINKGIKPAEEDAKQALEVIRKEVINVYSETDRCAAETDNATNAVKRYNQASKEAFNVSQVVNMISAIGQISFALQSISNIPSIFNDEDLTSGEKLLQILSAASSSVTTLMLAYKSLNGVLNITNALGLAFGAGKAVETAATEAATAALVKENLAQTAHQSLIALDIKTRRQDASSIAAQIIATEAYDAALTVESASLVAENYLKTINKKLDEDQIRAIIALVAAKKAETVATDKAALAQTGLNASFMAFPGTWIVLGLAAVVATIAGVNYIIDELDKKAEKAAESATEALENYTAGVSDLEDLESQLESVNSQLKELAELSDEDLSITDKEDIKNLTAEQTLLKAKIKLQEQLNELNEKETRRETLESVHEGYYNTDDKDSLKNLLGQQSSVWGRVDENKNGESIVYSNELFDELNADLTNDSLWNDYQIRQNELIAEAQANGDKTAAAQLQEQLDSISAARDEIIATWIEENQEKFNDALSKLSVLDPDTDSAEIKEIQNWILDYYKAAGTLDSTIADALSTSLSEDNYNSLQEQLQNVLNQEEQTVNEDILKQIFGENSDEIIASLKAQADALGISFYELLNNSDNLSITWETTAEKTDEVASKFEELRTNISSLNSAIETLASGDELDDDTIEDLKGKYAELGEIRDTSSVLYLEKLRQIREEEEDLAQSEGASQLEDYWDKANEAISDYQESFEDVQNKTPGSDRLNQMNQTSVATVSVATEDTLESLDSLQEAVENICNQKYELELSVTDDILTDVDDIVSAAQNAATAVELIGDGFKVAAEDSEELFNIFPELAHNAEVTADGMIQLDQQVVESNLENNGIEIDSDRQVTIEKIKTRIDELEAKKAVLEEQLKSVQEMDAAELAEDGVLKDLLGENAEAAANYDAETTYASAEAQVQNSAAAAHSIIANWAAEEEAAAGYAQTAAEAEAEGHQISNPERAQAADAKVVETPGESATSSADIESDSASISAQTAAKQEKLKQSVENYLVNQIDSYTNQIADLTQAWGELEASINGIGEAAEGESEDAKDPDLIDYLEDESDLYHDINLQLEKMSNNLSALQKQQDKLFGNDLIDNLNEQLDLLEAQNEAYQAKLALAQQDLANQQAELALQGVTFDEEGYISNYMAIYQAHLEYVNGLIAAYNAMSAEEQEAFEDTVDEAQDAFDDFVEKMENYDDLISSTIPDIEESIQDNLDSQIEINIEKFTTEVEIKLDMGELERDYNEFKRKVIDGIKDDDILGNAKSQLNDYLSYFNTAGTGSGTIQKLTDQVNQTMEQIKQIDSTGWSDAYGDDKAQAMEDLQNYYEELMSQLEDIVDLVDEIKESYLNMIDEAVDAFDEQVEQYEYINDLMNHDMNLISLLYGDDAYAEMSKYYDKIEQNNNQELDFLKQRVAYAKEMMDTETDEDAREKWEEEWENALSDLNDKVEDSVQNIIDKYVNVINEIFDELNDKVTNGLGLDYVSDEWDLINENAEQYLDNINAMQAIQELENKYIDAINDTDSVSAQKKLTDLMNEQVAALEEKEKLTQYDVDRANMLYEIALKEIALQEAQQNKSSLRLRRDSQGNYTYQYVADEDAVAEAEEDLAAAQNDLYNFDKEAYVDNLDQIYEAYQEFQEKLFELYSDQTLSAEEREQKKAMLVEQYETLINGLVEQNQTIRSNLMDSAFADLALLYDTDVENFKNMSAEEQEELMESLVPQWNSSVQEMADTFAGEGGLLPTCQDAFEQLEEATQEYGESLDELEVAAGIDFDSIAEGYDENIEKAQELLEKNDELIQKYADEIDAIQAVIAQLDSLIDQYANAQAAAEAATSAAYAFIQAQNAAVSVSANSGGTYSSSTGTGTYSGSTSSSSSSSSDSSTSNSTGTTSTDTSSTNIGGTNPTKVHLTGWVNSSSRTIYDPTRWAQEDAGVDAAWDDVYALLTEVQNHWVTSGWAHYNTGGYTGDWSGSDGKVAVLHQKELVLNKDDTSNILSAVSLVRNIDSLLNNINQAVLDKLSNLFNLGSGYGNYEQNSDTLDQNVTISANFPNVSSSIEIEDALNNLINTASQYAYRQTI